MIASIVWENISARHQAARHQRVLALRDSTVHHVQMSPRPLTVSPEIFVPKANTVRKGPAKVTFHL